MSIEVTLASASTVSPAVWGQLQMVALDGFGESFPGRSREEIEALAGWNDPDRFATSHINPNTEVGRRYNPNQTYYDPMLAIAEADGVVAGFAYTAHNVSGPNEAVRRAKSVFPSKRYLWLREAVVHPDFQHRGVAVALGSALLSAAGVNKNQPVSTYIWPDEMPSLQPRLTRLGFRAQDETRVAIFGEGSEPVRQVRMVAPYVGNVLRRLAQSN